MKRINNCVSAAGLKILFCSLPFLFFCACGFCQTEQISSSIDKQSFIYAVKDTNQLGLDVYTLRGSDSILKKPTILFVFGGAFIAGRRDDTLYNRYFNSLVEHNYNVVSISYRLGMKGVKNVSKFNIAPLRNAIDMAVEDVYDATNWIIDHAGQFGVDDSKIILSGSSSGAITVLNADYDRRNDHLISNKLPGNFEYAGVVSFSGAVLSFDWGLKYNMAPAPMLLFHGTADKIVPYNKIGFLNKGFYGSGWIAKICRENNYPFYLYSEAGLGHEVSVYPMYENLPTILDFIETYIVEKKPLQIDYYIKDSTIKPVMLLTPEELFKKLQQQ